MRSIGIDCRFAPALAGLGTFTRELTSALVHADQGNMFVLFVMSDKETWLAPLLALPHVSCRVAPAKPYSWAEQTAFPKIIKASGVDVLFVPHFNVPLFCPVPFVCTVHDLILHHYANQAPLLKRLAYRLVLAFAIRRARRIVTVSTATKHDVLSRYRIPEKKIATVYPGIAAAFGSATEETQKEAIATFALTAPFFLYVGNCKEHKNVQTLIDAFAASGLKTHQLLLASSGPECTRLTLVPGARFIGPVDARLLPSLYSLALCFVTATKLEGFCLPVLEAMASGCPVIASNVEPIPEVAGGHALLVSPEAAALADAMHGKAQSPPSPQHIAEAKKWASRFTWENAALELRSIVNAL